MIVRARSWRAALLPGYGLLLAVLLLGCGGGGGGGGTTILFGRSFQFSSGGQSLFVTIDATGRFTAYAKDTGLLTTGVGAQGTVTSNGSLSGQSSDGNTTITGNLSSDSTSITGTVQRTGTNVFSFTATLVTAGTSTSAVAGTYGGSGGGNSAILSVDPTGHGTLFAAVGATLGGGLFNIAADGTITTTDNSIAGQLTSAGGAFTLTLTRLAGVNVSASIALNVTTRAKWTFMVYLNGANNLDEFGPLNFNQMEQVGSTADVNIVVQWKRANCFDCGTPSWTGTRRYYVTKDNDTTNTHSTILQDMGQSVDMGDWRTLHSFIAWAQSSYPADHYALVIWNHGAGWRPTRAGTNRLTTPFPRSVSIDDATNNEIQIWELPQALAVTPQMDVVIFDASLMQMAEVAYEIRNSTPLVVGSEESPPGEGYVYNTFLSELAANPNMTPRDFGARIVTDTLTAYGHTGANTQSEIDTTKLDAVATRLDAFANKLTAHVGDSSTAETNARNNAQNYDYPENKDLWDYAAKIKAASVPADLANAATDLQTAIQAAVLVEDHGSLRANSHGLAVYVPDPLSYLASYANLALARNTAWDTWLQNQPH